jgi:hypothetical protein
MKKSLFITISVLVIALTGSCSKEQKGNPTDSANDLKSALSNTAFNLWQTGLTKPYLISGSNGICVPVGGTELDTNYVGAQQNVGQYATGLQFYGCFKGGSNAPDGSNEMAVFITDDVTNWIGHEMGFVKTLNDNTLKAYVQGGGNYIWQVISTNDNGYHTYTCQCDSDNHSMVVFYVDGAYKCTLQNPGSSYWNNWDYIVGTTHRTSGGWNSTSQQIEMYNIVTY